jgi:hypothetical protein
MNVTDALRMIAACGTHQHASAERGTDTHEEARGRGDHERRPGRLDPEAALDVEAARAAALEEQERDAEAHDADDDVGDCAAIRHAPAGRGHRRAGVLRERL